MTSLTAYSLLSTTTSQLKYDQSLDVNAKNNSEISASGFGRSPASIPITTKNANQKSVIVHNCGASEVQHSIDSEQVVLKLTHCGDSKYAKNVKLSNLSNEYAAQIFKSKNNDFYSDFIQLKKGENILRLEFSLNDKQNKTQIIKIHRLE